MTRLSYSTAKDSAYALGVVTFLENVGRRSDGKIRKIRSRSGVEK